MASDNGFRPPPRSDAGSATASTKGHRRRRWDAFLRPCCLDLRAVLADRRVAIYGGAFDPVTNAHLTCVAEIVHSGKAEEVWLVPCGQRPDKPNLRTPPLDRYVMCQIAVNTTFSPGFPIKVSDIECFEPEAMFTYDLLCGLRDRHLDVDFSFVIGSDWLQPGTNINTWRSRNRGWKEGDPEEEKTLVAGHKLLKEFEFLVIRRPGFDVQGSSDDPTGLNKFGPRLQWLSMERGMTFIEGNLSSTEIRKRRKLSGADGQSNASQAIEGLVPVSVLSYIRRAGLYSA